MNLINKLHIPIKIKLTRFSQSNTEKGVSFIYYEGYLLDGINFNLSGHNFSTLLELVLEVSFFKVSENQTREIQLVVNCFHGHNYLCLPIEGINKFFPQEQSMDSDTRLECSHSLLLVGQLFDFSFLQCVLAADNIYFFFVGGVQNSIMIRKIFA